MDVTYRPWAPGDTTFLWEMLHQSIHVRPGQPTPTRSVLDEPSIAHYLSGFGEQAGDDAEIACDAAGERIGAAFCRRLDAGDAGYGYVADDIPEVGMAVVAEHRGRGIGRGMLTNLLLRHPAMSLSVDDDNAGARRLYESLGFEPVTTVNTATTMLRRETTADR